MTKEREIKCHFFYGSSYKHTQYECVSWHNSHSTGHVTLCTMRTDSIDSSSKESNLSHQVNIPNVKPWHSRFGF